MPRGKTKRKKVTRGKMKGKQRGHAVKVKGFTRTVKGKKVRVKGYRRGKPGGKRG